MKKYYWRTATALLACAGLFMASCSDSDDEGGEQLPEPNFPATTIDAPIEAGATYSFSLEPNQAWKLDLKADENSSGWFWFQNGEIHDLTMQGNTAGKIDIVIGTLDAVDYDTEHSCEVQLTMNQQTRTVAKFRIGKEDRELTVYSVLIDEDDMFVYDETGKHQYAYSSEPVGAEGFSLVWPYGGAGFRSAIKVAANFDWAIGGELPEWLSLEPATGNAGETFDIVLTANATKYPVEGATADLTFIDKNTEAETGFSVKASIPDVRNLLEISSSDEIEFDAKGRYYNAAAGSWQEGSVSAAIRSAAGARAYLFSVEEGYLDENAGWATVESTWDDAAGNVQSYDLKISAAANSGSARKAIVMLVPASIAAEVDASSDGALGFLTDWMQVKPEYEQYIVTTVSQAENAGPISASEDAAFLASLGTDFKKYATDDWQNNVLRSEFGTSFNYALTYSKEWGYEDWMLVFDEEPASYKCFDWTLVNDTDTFTELADDLDSWLIYQPQQHRIQMTSSEKKEGVVVFYDAAGDAIAAIHCIYDPSFNPGGGGSDVEVSLAYEQEGVTLENVTGTEIDTSGTGAPAYLLTVKGDITNVLLNVPTFNLAMSMDASDWLMAESMGTQCSVMISTESSASGSLLFYDSSWTTILVIYCNVER